jgi:hypothetical protein
MNCFGRCESVKDVEKEILSWIVLVGFKRNQVTYKRMPWADSTHTHTPHNTHTLHTYSTHTIHTHTHTHITHH